MSEGSSNANKRWFQRTEDFSAAQAAGVDSAADWRSRISSEMRAQYQRDGVLYLPQLLHPEWLALIELGVRRNLMYPSPHRYITNEGTPNAWVMDYGSYESVPEYRHVIELSPIADVMQYLLDTRELWLFHDQIFVKQSGDNGPTFWHQDLPYWIIDGTQIGSMWITLDPIPKKYCLEFIPGSHHGPQYAGSTFNPADPTEPFYPTLPRIPNIAAERDKWNIVSWDITPGDVVIIHPGVLHGGGSTGPGMQRRTISFRFYGDDVVMDGRFARENQRPEPYYPGLSARLQPGDPMRDPRFPKLRSETDRGTT